MKSSKLTALSCCLFVLFYLSSPAAVYYWVGGTGNWSDATNHWANTSGGIPGTGLVPTSADSVVIDGFSFVSTDIINVDVAATCEELLLDGQGTLLLNNSLQVLRTIRHFNGIFTANGQTIQAETLNSNPAGDPLRTLDISGSVMTLSGSGTVLDLRGNTANLILVTNNASTVNFTATAAITVQVGTQAKTLPHFNFTAITTNAITITSGNAANTIVFRNISKTAAGNGALNIDNGTTNTTFKEFGVLSISNSTQVNIGTRNAASYGATPRSFMNGAITMGNGCSFTLSGSFLDITQPFTMGTTASFDFQNSVRFTNTSNVTIASSNSNLRFRNQLIMDCPFNLNGNITSIEFDNTSTLNGAVNFANAVTALIRTDGGQTLTFNGPVNIGTESVITFGNTASSTPFVFSAINSNAENRINFNNASSSVSIGNLSISSFDQVEFNTNGTTTITNTLTASITCRNWAWITSNNSGLQAALSFTIPQMVTGLMVSSINCTSANFTVSSGVDQGGNTGITFGGVITPTNYYWVGGTAGNPKSNPSGTGNNNHWSNCANWATTSGDISNSNTCIPSILDNVIFNDQSFTHASNKTVDIDISTAYCNNMSWNVVAASGALFDNGINNAASQFFINGSLYFDSDMTNAYEGLFTFVSENASPDTIACNGEPFIGNIEFDYDGTSWILASDLDVNNSSNRGNITITRGTLDASTSNYSIFLAGDWFISNNTSANFLCRQGTVTFDGNQNDINITTRNKNFYNLVINNGTTTNDIRIRNNHVVVQNNFTITRGELFDSDEGNEGPFTITGGGSGIMTIGTNGRLFLGDNGGTSNVTPNIDNPALPATSLPTGFSSYSFADGSIVTYRHRGTQSVTGGITYGNLTLDNANNTMRTKNLSAPLTVTARLFVGDDIQFLDNGFQITGDNSANAEIEMQNGQATLVLGNAAVATEFPTNMPIIDLGNQTQVIYNSSQAQTVRALSAGNTNASYPRLWIRNPSTKTLAGAIYVRDSLTLTAGATLDVSASNFSIDLMGHWFNNASTFTARNGRVNWVGTANQDVTSGNQDFYEIRINNASHVDPQDVLNVSGSCIFSNGNVRCAAPNILHFRDNATHSGASNSSHAAGTVKKTGNEVFEFPLGTGSVFRPCGLATAPSSTTDEFSAYYVNGDPGLMGYDRNAVDATLDHVSSCEYWMISRDAGVSSVRIQLSWEQTSSCAVTDPNTLAVAHWDGTVWKDEGNSAASPLGASGYITSTNLIASFSPFTLADLLGGAYNPLPVDLIAFDASLNDSRVHLNWVTQQEVDVCCFLLEKSANGLDFVLLDTVVAMGNTTDRSYYQFEDMSMRIGKSFYRLQVVDRDGSKRYSNRVAVEYLSDEVRVFPVPVDRAELHIDLGVQNEPVLVVLQDVLGKVIYEKLYVSPEENILEGKGKLDPGIYLIVASNNHMLVNRKILVK
ncbi:MAG: hypothetical protein MUF42_13685 [Cytophagaceae bacterium]|jgi:hypothetical protein|nr:hypothetical protein [Cytophagaceae bacterium]